MSRFCLICLIFSVKSSQKVCGSWNVGGKRTDFGFTKLRVCNREQSFDQIEISQTVLVAPVPNDSAPWKYSRVTLMKCCKGLSQVGSAFQYSPLGIVLSTEFTAVLGSLSQENFLLAGLSLKRERILQSQDLTSDGARLLCFFLQDT